MFKYYAFYNDRKGLSFLYKENFATDEMFVLSKDFKWEILDGGVKLENYPQNEISHERFQHLELQQRMEEHINV